MHQRMLYNKILIPLTRSVWLGHVNKCSNDGTKNVEEFSTDNLESSYNTQDVSHLLEQSTTYKDANDKNWATTPYPKDVLVKKTDDEEPSIEPENTSVLLFPGQDGIRLVHVRGNAMQHAADQVPQGMMSVVCTREAKVSKACTDAEKWAMEMGIENPICRVAIFLCTERKIFAGNIEALQYIEKHSKELGFRNISRLPVSGAFHTPLMNPSLKPVFKILTSIELDEPRCKVYSNYKGKPYGSLQFMKKYILKQIVSPLKWEQCIQNIYSRSQNTSFPKTYDIASEGRMKTILKLINAKAHNSCIAI
ncbi:malonyl-CoA-acyl carrier protein transacylase, mitochondrial isoform X2 [Colletes gigas]|uniref:malonyl-CoA-acyl carrier protein transacylase, mitochondrial isoform X2 n=1 Tax=Colletes gigas TaxID=935657 RepID=UPI001C9B69A7|nr:malonyl-CoA-acyl carrier protein transacylase, mitochondrial isoform X2 [Colletes gigas]